MRNGEVGMSRSIVRGIGALLLLGAVVQAPRSVWAADRKPNIVFILADDLGYTDVACYGSRYYETPNIDKLAVQGLKFTNGYTCEAQLPADARCLVERPVRPAHRG